MEHVLFELVVEAPTLFNPIKPGVGGLIFARRK